MIKSVIFKLVCLVIMVVGFSSCTSVHKTMKEPNLRVEFYKADFSLSPQVSAEATATTILGIDFERLFMKQTANSEVGSSGISLATLPVIGNVLGDKTSGYALYELLNSNQGYDVIFYPQYETKVVRPLLGLGFLMKTTTVKTTARLGKLN